MLGTGYAVGQGTEVGFGQFNAMLNYRMLLAQHNLNLQNAATSKELALAQQQLAEQKFAVDKATSDYNLKRAKDIQQAALDLANNVAPEPATGTAGPSQTDTNLSAEMIRKHKVALAEATAMGAKYPEWITRNEMNPLQQAQEGSYLTQQDLDRANIAKLGREPIGPSPDVFTSWIKQRNELMGIPDEKLTPAQRQTLADLNNKIKAESLIPGEKPESFVNWMTNASKLIWNDKGEVNKDLKFLNETANKYGSWYWELQPKDMSDKDWQKYKLQLSILKSRYPLPPNYQPVIQNNQNDTTKTVNSLNGYNPNWIKSQE